MRSANCIIVKSAMQYLVKGIAFNRQKFQIFKKPTNTQVQLPAPQRFISCAKRWRKRHLSLRKERACTFHLCILFAAHNLLQRLILNEKFLALIVFDTIAMLQLVNIIPTLPSIWQLCIRI